MNDAIKELPPIQNPPSDWDGVEKIIKDFFKAEIYLPLIRDFYEPKKVLLQNAKQPFSALWEAMRTGKVTFYRGVFSGKFNAAITKELKSVGAVWDKKTSTFKAAQSSFPIDLKNVISSTESKFQEKLNRIDEKLAQILPEKIAGTLSLHYEFDTVLWKAEKKFQDNVRNITVTPKLTKEQRKKIADEWQNNMRLFIKDFTETQIKKLRADMKTTVFSGDRYGSAIKTIQESYGVSANKAKFLARQETNLLVSKFQETRYSDAGITEYTWHTVVGSPKHPVRPQHKALADASKKGKIYKWNEPPITSEPGEPERRNNPKQDYNCRCFAKPVVRFKK